MARRDILADYIARYVQPPKDARILEIGCGTGHNLPMLGAFGTVDAIEIDEAARNVASARLGKEVGTAPLPELSGVAEGQYDLIAVLDVVEHVEADRVYLDGSVLIGALDGVVRDRIRMALNGHVIVNVILEDDEPLGEPWVEIMGLPETGGSNAPLVDVLEEDLNQFLMRAADKTLRDDDKLEEELRRIARKSTQDEIGKKPEVTVVISRLS